MTHCGMSAELKKSKAANAALQEPLNYVSNLRQGDDREQNLILKPKGTAGTQDSMQVEMGLSGSKKKNDQYKGVQVCASNDVLTESQLTINAACPL
jgi:hypothetical protein